MEKDMIITKNLTKRYKNLIAVNDVSFEVLRGQPIAIIGRNGAGKSTIIKMILGLLAPTSGNIHVPLGLRVGYLPEERGVYQDVSVEDHLTLFAKLSGVKNVSVAISESLKRFEILKYRKFPLKNLSKGNAQRVQFAIALINDPDLIILDEPLSGIDPISSQMFENIIREESEDKIVITSSHNMSYIEKICEKVILLDKGNVVVCEELEKIKKKYGKHKLKLPICKKLITRLKEYKYSLKDNYMLIENIHGMKDYRNIIKKISDIEGLDFIQYGYSNLEEIFIDLLGENNE